MGALIVACNPESGNVKKVAAGLTPRKPISTSFTPVPPDYTAEEEGEISRSNWTDQPQITSYPEFRASATPTVTPSRTPTTTPTLEIIPTSTPTPIPTPNIAGEDIPALLKAQCDNGAKVATVTRYLPPGIETSKFLYPGPSVIFLFPPDASVTYHRNGATIFDSYAENYSLSDPTGWRFDSKREDRGRDPKGRIVRHALKGTIDITLMHGDDSHMQAQMNCR